MFDSEGEVPFIKVYNLTHHGKLDFSVRPTFISRQTHEGLLSRSKVKSGDVLINIVGPPLGKVSLVPQDYPEWNINQAIVLFRPAAGVLNKYLVYAFLTEPIMERVTKLAKATAGQHNIGVSMCRELLPIPLAPENEQRRIVAKIEELFSDLDAGVAALELVRANLKRYRASVLKAAVEGKLTEDWRTQHPDTEPASVLLERILTERRRQWEKDQLAKFVATGSPPPKGWKEKYKEPVCLDVEHLAELPARWTWANVGQVADIQGGIQKQPSRKPTKNKYPFLRVANVLRGRLDLSEVHEIELLAGELDRLRLQSGDLLIVEGNGSKTEIGRSALWEGGIPDCVHQNHIIRARLLDGTPEYLDAYWNSPAGTSRIWDLAASTSGLYTLSVGRIASLPVPLPPLEEQKVIAAEVERLLSIVNEIEAQIAANLKRAVRLRQGILKRAFEGRLVPQDPTDEPAVTLLERIERDRSGGASSPSAQCVRQASHARSTKRKH